MTEHELKTWPSFFGAIMRGIKKFEIRKDDRGFALGDILHLREWDPDTDKYTGAGTWVVVTYIVRACPGLEPGYVIMGVGY